MGTGAFGGNAVCGICSPGAGPGRHWPVQRNFLFRRSTDGRIWHSNGAGSKLQRCPADGFSLGGNEGGWRRFNGSAADDRPQSCAGPLDSGHLSRCSGSGRCDPVTGRDFEPVLSYTRTKSVVRRSDGGAEIRIEIGKWKSEIGRSQTAMSWLDGFFGRRKREKELTEEVQSHLEMAAQERAERGEKKGEAERAARREFGT